jgi:hypothetical protein
VIENRWNAPISIGAFFCYALSDSASWSLQTKGDELVCCRGAAVDSGALPR